MRQCPRARACPPKEEVEERRTNPLRKPGRMRITYAGDRTSYYTYDGGPRRTQRESVRHGRNLNFLHLRTHAVMTLSLAALAKIWPPHEGVCGTIEINTFSRGDGAYVCGGGRRRRRLRRAVIQLINFHKTHFILNMG